MLRGFILFVVLAGAPLVRASYLQTSPNVQGKHIALSLFGGAFPNSNDFMAYSAISYGWNDDVELQALMGLGTLDFLAGGYLKYFFGPDYWAPISVQFGLTYWNQRGYIHGTVAVSHDFGFVEPYLAAPIRVQFLPGQFWIEIVPGFAFPLTKRSALQVEATLPVLNSAIQVSGGVRWYL